MSLCCTVATCNGGGGWHAQHVGDAWGSHAAEMASVFAAHVRARCASGGPADGQPVASDSSTAAAKLLTCKRVLPRESMCTAGEARTRGSCVSSVLCTRVLVCKAQRSERGRGSGEDAAHPGALAVGGAHSFARWSGLLHCKSKKNPFTPFTKHAARRNKHEGATLALLPLGCSGGQCARSGDHRLPSAVRSSS